MNAILITIQKIEGMSHKGKTVRDDVLAADSILEFEMIKMEAVHMYEVIYMKAEYEPWWLFEGWEETIQQRIACQTIGEAQSALLELVGGFRKKYESETLKDQCFYTFWTKEERVFCEACDEDLQIFHGVFMTKNGEPLKFS